MLPSLLPVAPFQETLNAQVCGPATLKMLLTFWNLQGHEMSDVELARECGTVPGFGTTNLQLIETAERFGLTCVVKNDATFDDILHWLDKGVPVVVDWFSPGRKDAPEAEMPDGHYSIVVGLDESFIYIQDPELGGLRTIAREQFWRVWFDFDTDALETPDDLILRQMIAAYPTKTAL